MTANETRVACLYRVSLNTDGGGIPAQRNACLRYVSEQPGWRVVFEYTERGVSGYRLPESKRPALTRIKGDAEARLFDVLLVYMGDRLGRRDDETPFVVEWLAARGVEVYSVTEGRLTAEGHTGRLMNYLRYWLSEGESAATSTRVSEKHRQMVLSGRYRGGTPPYGYTLAPKGAEAPAGRERGLPLIDEKEAAVVRMMYAYAYEHSVGCYSAALHLSERHIFTRYGHKWTAPAVARVLRNPIYKGEYVSGRVRGRRGKKERADKSGWTRAAEPLPELAIISSEIWDAVNKRMDERNAGRINKQYPRMALAGIVYCGYCGAGLAAGGGHKRYDCPRRMRLNECGGAHGYSARKVESAVWEETARALFLSIKADDLRAAVIKRLGQREIKLKRTLKKTGAAVIARLTGGGGAADEAEEFNAQTNALNRVRQVISEIKTSEVKTSGENWFSEWLNALPHPCRERLFQLTLERVSVTRVGLTIMIKS